MNKNKLHRQQSTYKGLYILYNASREYQLLSVYLQILRLEVINMKTKTFIIKALKLIAINLRSYLIFANLLKKSDLIF